MVGDGLRDLLDPQAAEGDLIMANAAQTAAPLLQVRHLRTHFFTDAGVVKSVEDVSFALEHRRNAGHRRRIRLRQVGDQPVDHGPDSESAWAHRRRRDPVPNARRPGGRPREAAGEGAAQAPRPRYRDDLPGADDEPQSRAYRRRPDRGSRRAASRHGSRRGDEARAGDAGARGNPCGGAAGTTNIRISCPAACGSG